MRRLPYIAVLIVCIACAETRLFASEYNYTFAGAAFSGGLLSTRGSDWVDTHQQNVRSSGYYGTGGLTAQIFVTPLVGEYSLFFAKTVTVKPALYYLEHMALIKYVYRIHPLFSATAGGGIYLESPPSTRAYKGGGGVACLGCIFLPAETWRITADIFAGYGACSLGTDATKFFAGLKVGVTAKVGRM